MQRWSFFTISVYIFFWARATAFAMGLMIGFMYIAMAFIGIVSPSVAFTFFEGMRGKSKPDGDGIKSE